MDFEAQYRNPPKPLVVESFGIYYQFHDYPEAIKEWVEDKFDLACFCGDFSDGKKHEGCLKAAPATALRKTMKHDIIVL